jgi:hypothetical protein
MLPRSETTSTGWAAVFRGLILRPIVSAGPMLLLAGVLVGPAGLSLLSTELLDDIAPLLVFALGWLGFLLGFQLPLKVVFLIPGRSWLAGGGQALATTLVTGAFLTVVAAAGWLVHLNEETAIGIALCAGVSSPVALSILRRDSDNPRSMMWLELMASIDNVAIILFTMVVMGLYHTVGADAAVAEQLSWVVAPVGLGLIVGLIIESFFRSQASKDELLLLGLGSITFAAGIAAYLQLSPLVVCFFAGMLVRNVPNHRIRLLEEVLYQLERPMYFLLLFILGIAAPAAPGAGLVTVAIVVAVVRAAMKILGGEVIRRSVAGADSRKGTRWSAGVGLLMQGGLAAALAVDAALRLPPEQGQVLVFVVVTCVLLSDLVALPLVGWSQSTGALTRRTT